MVDSHADRHSKFVSIGRFDDRAATRRVAAFSLEIRTDSLRASLPLATLMEPPIIRMMEPGGGTQRPKEVVSRLGSGVERGQGRARLWRRRSGLGLVTGAEGGGPSLSTLGLRRERYDSPSTTRS